MYQCRLGLFLLLATGTGLAGRAAADEKSGANDPMHPRVKLETSLGDFVLELDAEKAPITVLNFIQYVDDKFYDGTIFHRVIDDFMIQGGGFTADMEQKDGLRPPIKNEWQNGLKNERGTIAMARTRAPDSATSQFYINVVDNDQLDLPSGGAAYCVFGKVVDGMDTVDKIRNTEVGPNAKYGGGRMSVVPVEPVVIKSARLVSEFDRTQVENLAKEVQDTERAEREALIKPHLKKFEEETGKQGVITDSGLAYIDLKEGNGPSPDKTDKVEVHYTGWLLDGTKFDSSVDRGKPFTFSLTGGVIQGWLEGVASMKVGGKRKLIIPPDLGYGKRGSPPTIPPNSVLVFDVELLRIISND